MARKETPSFPPKDHPSNSSSSAEEADDNNEDEDPEEDDDATSSSSSSSLPPTKEPNSMTTPASHRPSSSSDGESDTEPSPGTNPSQSTSKPPERDPSSASEYYSDSEPGSEQPPPSPKPPTRTAVLPSKPVGESSKLAGDPSPKKMSFATPSKRPSQHVASDEEEPTAKKQLFQRRWNEEDEIEILKGMLDYMEKEKGMDPLSDITGVFNFIRDSIRISCTRPQFADKVRRMKKKYQNNVKRLTKGKNPTFSKPQVELYELSKKIWGGGPQNKNEETRNNGHVKDSPSIGHKVMMAASREMVRTGESLNTSEEVRSGLLELCGNETGLNEAILRKGVSLMDVSKVAELEFKWNQLRMMEVELHLKRVELVKEQVQAIFDTFAELPH